MSQVFQCTSDEGLWRAWFNIYSLILYVSYKTLKKKKERELKKKLIKDEGK